MKKKLLSLASLLAVLNANAIEIGPTGSGVELGGFAVLDYVSDDGSGDSKFMLSEVEVNLDYSTGPVAFSIDIDAYKDGVSDDGSIEEAVLTYTISDNLSVSAGRMLSYLGFEAYDAPNLYQISTAYVSSYAGYLYDGYADGVSVDYATDSISVGIWTDLAEESSFEYAFAYTGVQNLTAKYIYADYADSPESKQTIWASYTFDKLLVAAEYALNEAVGGVAANERDGYLLLGNYALTDALSLTLRYSNTEDSGSTFGETDKYTISPTYMVTDDLALLAEYSDIEGKTDFFGIEAIYTF
jgi:hypothetical protein